MRYVRSFVVLTHFVLYQNVDFVECTSVWIKWRKPHWRTTFELGKRGQQQAYSRYMICPTYMMYVLIPPVWYTTRLKLIKSLVAHGLRIWKYEFTFPVEIRKCTNFTPRFGFNLYADLNDACSCLWWFKLCNMTMDGIIELCAYLRDWVTKWLNDWVRD